MKYIGPSVRQPMWPRRFELRPHWRDGATASNSFETWRTWRPPTLPGSNIISHLPGVPAKAIPHVTTRARARPHDLSTQARTAHYPCRIPFISILPVASCRHGNGPCSPLTAMLATRITLRVPSFSIGSVICGSLQTSANGSTFLERLQRSTIRSM